MVKQLSKCEEWGLLTGCYDFGSADSICQMLGYKEATLTDWAWQAGYRPVTSVMLLMVAMEENVKLASA